MEPAGGSGSEQTTSPGVERWARRVPVKVAAELRSVLGAMAENWTARALRKRPERLHWAAVGRARPAALRQGKGRSDADLTTSRLMGEGLASSSSR